MCVGVPGTLGAVSSRVGGVVSFRFKVLIVETLSETFHVPQSGLSQTESGRLPLKTTAANGVYVLCACPLRYRWFPCLNIN